MSSIWKLFGKQDATTAEAEAGEAMEPRLEPPPSQGDRGEAEPLALTSVKPSAPPDGRPVLPPKQRYGIDDAIKLMRTLPVDDNVDLVVRVIKRTLESLSVRVPDILEDAQRRQETLRSGISEHQAAIQQLEREIETRRAEIAHLEDELAETTTVRERLQLAENLQTSMPPKFGMTPPTPGTAKKPEAPPTGRSAPPLPTTFRPKLSSQDLKKTGSSAADATTPATPSATEDDAEEPVQSSDLLEKAP